MKMSGAGVKATAMALLLWSGMAAAQDAPKNRADEAEAKPRFVQDYEPKPALFRIADEDTTIYLFGTNHALAEGFRWRTPKLDAAIAAADELVLETADESVEDERATLYMQKLLASLGKLPPILMRVPEEKREALRQAIEKSGATEKVLDLMPTWLAAFGIAIEAMKKEGLDWSLGVEDVLTAEFTRAGKPISSIEDPLPIFEGLNALPETAQRRLLEEAAELELAKEAEAAEEDPFAIDHAWAKGELEALAQDMTPEELGPELYELLITRRNAAWVEWFEKRLERPGTVLVAVGAGHLAGPDSVRRLLKARGITVERVQ